MSDVCIGTRPAGSLIYLWTMTVSVVRCELQHDVIRYRTSCCKAEHVAKLYEYRGSDLGEHTTYVYIDL
jgi:hypothetical protein